MSIWVRDWVYRVISPFLTQLKNRLGNIKISFNGSILNFTDADNQVTSSTDIGSLLHYSNSFNKVYKTVSIDLRDQDVETMYPVKFRFHSRSLVSEVFVSRSYYADKELAVDADGNRVKQSERFSDGYSTLGHVAGLMCRLVGGDHPWGGSKPHGIKATYYDWSYMQTLQLFNNHRMYCYIQDFNDDEFTCDTEVKPTGNSPIMSGFYLRGGLKYDVTFTDLAYEPKVVLEPTFLYRNTSYNRSEWVAPFKYSRNNNSSKISNFEGL